MPKEAVTRKKVIQELQEKGWVTWYAPKVKYQQTDVFGIIDILAVKGRQRKNIQLTTLPNVAAKRKKIINFLTKYQIEMPVEIWSLDLKRKKIRKEKINIKISKTEKA